MKATENLLKIYNDGKLEVETLISLETILEDWKICTKKRRRRRFKLTVGVQNQRFNHVVQVETSFTDGKPAFHMVYEATHFTAARFLTK